MRTLLRPCGLLFATTTLAVLRLFAQPASPAFMQRRTENLNCPVEFNGLREGGPVKRTGSNARPSSYRLNLQFNNDDAARILEVNGTIRGFAAPRQPPVGSDSITRSEPEKQEETFHLLTGTYTARGKLIWPVRVRHVPVVTYIDLSEIRMNDGTVWHPSATSTCRIAIMK